MWVCMRVWVCLHAWVDFMGILVNMYYNTTDKDLGRIHDEEHILCTTMIIR